MNPYSMLDLPVLPVRGFPGDPNLLIAQRKRSREIAIYRLNAALSDYHKYRHDIDRLIDTLDPEKTAPAQDYDHVCSCPRAAMADGD